MTLPTDSNLETAPSMIIPKGTRIEIDEKGHLNIHAPGNLVIQNSGSYGKITSASGSIRIEADVQVEAIEVECVDVCYVQGSLTAWSVKAAEIQLHDVAEARVVLLEVEGCSIAEDARLVGNFSSERELFELLSRFQPEMNTPEPWSELPRLVKPAAIEGAAHEVEVKGFSAEEICLLESLPSEVVRPI